MVRALRLCWAIGLLFFFGVPGLAARTEGDGCAARFCLGLALVSFVAPGVATRVEADGCGMGQSPAKPVPDKASTAVGMHSAHQGHLADEAAPRAGTASSHSLVQFASWDATGAEVALRSMTLREVSKCFFDEGNSALGCEIRCRCAWHQQCFPHLISGATLVDPKGVVNVGVCGMSVAATILLSLVVVFTVFCSVVGTRVCLMWDVEEPLVVRVIRARSKDSIESPRTSTDAASPPKGSPRTSTAAASPQHLPLTGPVRILTPGRCLLSSPEKANVEHPASSTKPIALSSG